MTRLKYLILLLALLIIPSITRAQSTLVSATVTDAGGVAWVSGTYTFTSAAYPNVPIITGTLDSTGSFTNVTFPLNGFTSSVGSQWVARICPLITAPCFSKTVVVAYSTSINLTSSLIPPAITISALQPPPITAYSDTEIINASQGSRYLNVTDKTEHVCIALPCASNWKSILNTGGTTAPFLGPSPWIDITNPTYGGGATGNGSTDDTAAVQAAVSACPATGGTVFVPPTANSYVLSSKITLNTNCNYVGVGPASKFTYKFPATDNYPMFFCNGGNNVSIRGIHWVGSNAAGATQLLWTNTEGTINGQEGFFCLGCNDLEVHDNIAENLAGAGLLFVRGARERVHDNIANGNSYYGIYLLSDDNGVPTDDTIWSNTTRNNGCFGATCIGGRGIVMTTAGNSTPVIGAVNTKIGPHNIVEGNSLWGIEVYNAARSTEVFSNIVNGNGFGGIHDLRNVNANIHDNDVWGNGLANVPNGAGGIVSPPAGYCISVGSGYYSNVHDNNCHDNNNAGQNIGQITVTGEGNSTGAYGNKVISNHVRNNLAASGGFDVFVSATSVSSCPNTARFYKIAAYDASRNVLAVSSEVTNTPAATSVNLLTWKPINGAFSYGVFESATTGTENQFYLAMAPSFLDECAAPITTLSAPSSGTSITNVTLTNLTTAADVYGTLVADNDMFGSTSNAAVSTSDFNTITFNNPATVSNLTDIIVAGRILPNSAGQAFGSGGKPFAMNAYNITFQRSGGHMANGCDVCGPLTYGLVNPLMASADPPTITGAGCGGTLATIQNPNGTASFNIFTGTAPTSGGCTITMPAAASNWHCTADQVSAVSTTNFIIKQTGALSTTSVTLQLFSDVAAATAPAASDTWRVTCMAN